MVMPAPRPGRSPRLFSSSSPGRDEKPVSPERRSTACWECRVDPRLGCQDVGLNVQRTRASPPAGSPDNPRAHRTISQSPRSHQEYPASRATRTMST